MQYPSMGRSLANGMTISRAAERADVGVETIRFYERRGLIEQPQKPRHGGYRFYDDLTVERIRFIRQAQELGFSLRQIAELLSLRADPTADCSDVRMRAVSKREEVDRKIAQLRHIRAALDELIDTCPGGGALRACTIIDALDGHFATKNDRPSTNAEHEPLAPKGQHMKTTAFRIDGMHCEGCARMIETLVATAPGVRKATVSFKTREARVLFDPQVGNEDQIAAAIRKAGYSVANAAS